MPLIGFLGPILKGAGALAGIFGGGSKAAKEGRINESQILNDRDRNRILAGQLREDAILGRGNLELGRGGLDLQQRGFQETAPSNRLQQAQAADRVSNFGAFEQARNQAPVSQTFSMAGRNVDVPDLGRASLELHRPSQNTQDLAGLISQRALDAQAGGDQFDEFSSIPAFQDVGLSELPKAGFLEKALGFGAGLGGILGGVGEILGGNALTSRSGPADMGLNFTPPDIKGRPGLGRDILGDPDALKFVGPLGPRS